MNGSFYQKPTFPTLENDYEIDENVETDVTSNEKKEIKQNPLINKKIKMYISFANNSPWQNKMIECSIERIDDDYFIIKDINEVTYLIKKSNIDYIEFI